MDATATNWLLILAAAVAAALAAYRFKALTADGAVAAAGVGFVVLGWGGPGAAALLLVFFVSASALTKWSAGRRAPRSATRRDADGRRATQVLANGGVAALAALAAGLWPHPAWCAAFAGAIATVTADTWATEVGVLATRPPVMITTLRPAEPGQSGAVSAAGTAGGLAGAALIALTAAGVWAREGADLAAAVLAGAVWLAGVLGMFVDSVLGATVEGRWRWLGGTAVVGNDAVNGAASLAGALAAAGLYVLLAG